MRKQAIIDKALDNAYTLQEEVTPDQASDFPETETEEAAKPAPITIDQAEAIQQALQILAGNDLDMASEQNGIGFNRYDVRVGHSLATCQALSEAQAQLARKVVRKYKRQLPTNLVERIYS